ncbi:SMC-Scp complex subunit ScpB [Tepidibacillus fermentans]|uniref:Segregation and condensation protein B n=1 Tax=Tepidibacillus fermentans TaxID=1281767 RepID=A0A4R3KK61_9BACI|nr:SMC-Scp complex subunit ScpB [Tepidibacillus fermentans]TCS84094.1 segregation and condensation protein B [Tepidibacillus fermentans]
MDYDYNKIKAAIEGLLFVAGDEGIEAKQLSQILEIDVETIEDIIYDMQADYRRENRGLQIIQMANMYQLTTLPEHAIYFERLAASPTHATLSQAALETLSIIAYKQPITRSEIEEIRGVKSEKAINTLTSKGLIKEVGRMEGIGRPILYGTTTEFLNYFGLKNLNDLPPLPEDIMVDEDEEFELFRRD